MLLLESIGMEPELTSEFTLSAHPESDDLDFELCFTDHDDADAWSGVSLEKWCAYQEVPIDDEWDHLEDIIYNEFDADDDDEADEQTIHVCPDDEIHAPKTPTAMATASPPEDFEVIQHTTLTDLLVDIIFHGIRYIYTSTCKIILMLCVDSNWKFSALLPMKSNTCRLSCKIPFIYKPA